MAYVIRYHAKSGKNSYLTKKGTFKKSNSSGILTFNSIEKAQNYFTKSIKDDLKAQIFTNHSKDNFEIVDQSNANNKTPLRLDDKPSGSEEPIEMIPQSILDMTSIFDETKKTALILDLEFYQDGRADHKTEQHMSQIAGVILGDNYSSFNYDIFDPDRMSTDEQLEFLKQKDISYSQALRFSNTNVMKVVKAFLNRHNINTIISWGNGFDFKTLKDEGFIKYFSHMTAIDVEKVLAEANGSVEDSNGAISMSLKAVCNLLNLSNDGQWHDALSDVKMIKKVCNIYMNALAVPTTVTNDKNSNISVDGNDYAIKDFGNDDELLISSSDNDKDLSTDKHLNDNDAESDTTEKTSDDILKEDEKEIMSHMPASLFYDDMYSENPLLP